MKKRILSYAGVLFAGMLIVLVGCNVAVMLSAKGHNHDNVRDVGNHKYGLLLATSPITSTGGHNFYFENRIIATDSLFKAGKIQYVIASGGDYRKNHKYGCDEPSAIRDSLVARGVPEERIILDYEGTRTYNSIAKAKRNNLNDFIVISQKGHNERALSIAQHLGLNLDNIEAYNAKPSHILKKRVKNNLREYLARVKMYLDFYTLSDPDTHPYEINNR